ncbi:GerMN domain-containing protein [Carboxydothermus hydrogenoformans]|uniref:Putative lipoprotein protein n=1 Tax=Carboxydothermus hydrogenoformans (strain ATCC BAA-161 / DSM 6008 / Z-2901) TaxID=246194 RepID=Q3A9F4_CARHZ|nr:GerMN domain-containing protein [Carboxydothermus hydrogenoformans]ABB15816.1 putative lipoprotein protein [Carboxydothermus hydrogenoformans Z-2901]
MKKFFVLGSLIFLLLLGAGGCAKKELTEPTPSPSPKPAEKPVQLTVTDYFPVKANWYWEYEGEGNEFAGGRVDTEFIEGNRVQLLQQNGGTDVAEVFEVSENGVKLIYAKEESYWRINHLDEAPSMEQYYLKAPLKVGTTWKTGDITWSIESLSEKVKVPAGEFTCLKVVGKSKDNTIERYFANGVGLVKQRFIATGGATIEDNLKKYGDGEKDGNLPAKTLTLYYPSANVDKLLSEERTVRFKTGEELADKLTSILKEEKYKVLGKDVKLLNYVRTDQNLRLNFSRELISELNAGSAFEGLKIDSIVNTFGRAFGTEGVIINVEGKGYESGHFAFGKDEILKVKQ